MLRSVSQCFVLWGSQGYETGYIFSPSSEKKKKANYQIKIIILYNREDSVQQLFEIRILGASFSFQKPFLKDRERTLIEYSTKKVP